MSLSYVALGDSLSVGVGKSIFAPSFVSRYWRQSEKILKLPIKLSVFAKVGYETSDLVQLLKDQHIKSAIKKAQIITITVGGNDLIEAGRAYQTHRNKERLYKDYLTCKQNFSKIICSVHEIKGETDDHYIIRIPNFYSPKMNNEHIDEWINKYNRFLTSFHNDCNIKVIDLYDLFQASKINLLSRDGVHPNDQGYEMMTEAFSKAGYGQIIR